MKSLGLVKSLARPLDRVIDSAFEKPDPVYAPFISAGYVSLTGEQADQKPIQILRDTGAAQSVIITDALPWSPETYCGSHVILQGIETKNVPVPLHWVHLVSDLVSGRFRVGVVSTLPVKGVTLLLGNDIAGGNVIPVLEVVDNPEIRTTDEKLVQAFPHVFPACVLTRAQSRKLGDVVDLASSIFENVEVEDHAPSMPSAMPTVFTPVKTKAGENEIVPQLHDILLSVTPEKVIECQKEDTSLRKCFALVISIEEAKTRETAYFMEAGVLMRKWASHDTINDWSEVCQVVVPTPFRLAHDQAWSGHLGITKTYNRVLRHFFWPGLKSDVVQFCKTCHICQLTGKVNQTVPRAPLCPIPVVGEPFERVIIDCVGPLPKTRSGNQFLLTIMCSATRYPEAIPLRTITAKTVVKALVKFFSTFGLPKVIQTDQGSNFMSKLFSNVLNTLCISHQVSSPYHPESQGALERWHQTLKAMLRKYCMDTSTDWDEGVPFVLFAIRETIQESLGFSPADLVFGHTPRGPLKVLKEHILSPTPSSAPKNVLEYVSKMRDRLHAACALAQKSLSSSQKRMKLHYDKKAVGRSFAPGDQVLVLLPIPGSSLSARFAGPYLVEKKINDTNYVIKTPDRRRSSRVCHVNMLKTYYVRDSPDSSSSKPVQPAVSSVAAVVLKPGWDLDEDKEDGLELRHTLQQGERLCNSEMLKKLPSQMEHLDNDQTKDLILLINSFLNVFQDIPSRTSILEHDVDVGNAVPIRQHPYRVNAKKREVMKSEVAYLLQNDMAKPSNSSWSSPCILVPKPDGTSRLCTDYRRVNAVTKSYFPLPRLDDCIDRIGSAAYVSKLDLLKGYWQVPLTSRASDISAFVTPDNFVQYTVMPFGMCNAPATFQRLVNIVFADLPNCTAYLDDVVIHSSTWSDHLSTLKSVFQRLENASLTLNLAKCEFGKATVTYLGKQVGRGQVRPITGKVEAIVAFPAPDSPPVAQIPGDGRVLSYLL
uniref:Gypsy retrotransposon integrase-like protein 1 n=1 Tax=Oncorhynchus mykiss TaxID=8022 RepID=A0A8K9UAB6_ONCMY